MMETKRTTTASNSTNTQPLLSATDDFPHVILDLPVLTAPITTFTTSADLDRQVSEAVSQGNSLYDLDADQLIALKPTVIVTQVS